MFLQERHVGKRVHVEILIIGENEEYVRLLLGRYQELLVGLYLSLRAPRKMKAYGQADQLPESHAG